MNRQIDINTKLRLALCMGNLQLKDKESFTDAQISVAQRSMKKIERFLRHTDDPEYTASELLREIHTAFKYYSNTFSVLYKISRRSTEDYSAESPFYPYKEHCLKYESLTGKKLKMTNIQGLGPTDYVSFKMSEISYVISGMGLN